MPMHILSRYVLIELLKVFLVALTVLTAVIMLVGVVREAASQGLGPAQIARLAPYILPDALRFSVPGTLLFAACSVYGRMSGSNEMLAVKSLGISPLSMLWPVLGFSVFVSLAAVWLNDVAVSWGTAGVRRVVVEEAAEIAYRILRTQRSYSSRHFTVTVQAVTGRKLVAPIFSFQATSHAPSMTVRADEAELWPDAEKDALTITFRNASVEMDGQMSASYPENWTIEIPLENASQTARASDLPAFLPLRAIPPKITEQTAKIEQLEQTFAVEAACQMLAGDFAELTGPGWKSREGQRQSAVSYLHRLETEPYRRWAGGFSCLCFVIVGAPMAIRLRNCDVLTTFFLCFLPILILYYPLLAYGIDAAKRGQLPPYCVWMGNVALVGWGAWLLRKVVRY